MIKRTLLSLVALSFTGGVASSQIFVYAMSEFGRVSVNGTRFFSLSGDFDPEDPTNPHWEHRWYHQAVSGHDQFHLRRDGRVDRNGERFFINPPASDNWFRIAVSPGGDVYCLEFLGKVSANGSEIHDLPDDAPNNLVYQDFLYYNGDTYALRRDGKVYKSTTETWDFEGTMGTGVTRFMSFAFDPTSDDVYALRIDGNIYKGESGGASAGSFLADLPGAGAGDEEYSKIFIDAGGQIWALREDGRVYQVDKTTGGFTLFVDYRGDGSPENQDFRDFGVLAGVVYAVRWDGAIFLGANEDPICSLEGRRYRSLSLSDQAPDTTNVKEYKTVVSTYKTTCYPNDLVTFPILATDINDGTLVFNAVSVPAWGTLDTQVSPPLFSGTPTAVGKYTLEVEVGAQGKRTKVYKYKIKVAAADGNPAKNKKPKFQKIKKIQALVGVPIAIPIRAYDADGDVLSYAVGGVLPVGMAFDPMSQVLTWIPPICAGKVRVQVTADDGSGKLAKGKVQIIVVTPFHF